MEPTTIVWFRRDLRLEDNPALGAAARVGRVVPVYIWSPLEEGQFFPGRCSRWWLKQSLAHLANTFASIGTPLILRASNNTLGVLLDIARTTGATQLYYNHLYDPVSLVRDHKVKQGLSHHGVAVYTFNADLLYEPWEVYDDDGHAFTTFEAFWSKCLSGTIQPEPPLHVVTNIRPALVPLLTCTADQLGLEDEVEKDSNTLLARAWVPGAEFAQNTLIAFLQGPLLGYSVHRGKADGATTSLLSPHLHFGEISVRKVLHMVKLAQAEWRREGVGYGPESVETFLRSLGYREYSRYLSFNFPFTHERALLANLKSFPWRIDEVAFTAWRQGRTGYPLVDAGMRELWATGWLHNRIRVMVSSFCVKFLQLPWRWGMKYFWDTLLDADLESDVLGWQFISGSLPDGHDLDRMENPEVEGYKYDPHGEYVRRWLPELTRLPTEWIHHPWDASPRVLRAAGVELGANYPRPIVQLAIARERLQDALAVMWERESTMLAARKTGVEEGLGETVEVQGTGGGQHMMRVPRAVVRQQGSGLKSGGSSRRDQMVPTMPSPQTVEAAESIMRGGPSLRDGEDGVQPPSPEDSSKEGTRVQPLANSEEALPASAIPPSSAVKQQGRVQRHPLIGQDGPREIEGADSTAESFAPHIGMQRGCIGGAMGGVAAQEWSKQGGGVGEASTGAAVPRREEEEEGQRGTQGQPDLNQGQEEQEDERLRKRTRRKSDEPSTELRLSSAPE